MSDIVSLPVKIAFAKMDNPPVNLLTWLAEKGLDIDQLPPFSVQVDIDLDDIDDDDLAEAYQSQFDDRDLELQWTSRAYRYLAEGDIKAAMEEMALHCSSLRSPDHEVRLARLVSPAPPSLL